MRGWTAALLLVLGASALSGCLGAGDSTLVVVASAPRINNGMTIAVGVPRTMFEDGEGVAYYFVKRDGAVLYPPEGVLGGYVQLVEGRGSSFVPYANFVIENGEYEVTVTYKDRSAMARTSVDKWVNFVYVFPYLRNDTVVVDLVLERSSGQPNDRIFTAGQLNLVMKYRGEDGTRDEVRYTRSVRSEGLDSFTRVEIPLDSIQQTDKNRGYYSLEATFHNEHANGNNNVPTDPALKQSNPPTNWVYLELADRCTSLVPPVEPVLPCLPR